MKFRNANFVKSKQSSETTTIVACVATSEWIAKIDQKITWEPCDDLNIDGLDFLYSKAGVQYYGFL